MEENKTIGPAETSTAANKTGPARTGLRDQSEIGEIPQAPMEVPTPPPPPPPKAPVIPPTPPQKTDGPLKTLTENNAPAQPASTTSPLPPHKETTPKSALPSAPRNFASVSHIRTYAQAMSDAMKKKDTEIPIPEAKPERALHHEPEVKPAPPPPAPVRSVNTESKKPSLPADAIPNVIGEAKPTALPEPIAAGDISLNDIRLSDETGTMSPTFKAKPATSPTNPPPKPAPPPVPQTQTTSSEKKGGLPHIRTYANDITDAKKRQSATAFSLRETGQKAVPQLASETYASKGQKSWLPMVIIGIIILLITAGIGSVAFVLLTAKNKPSVEVRAQSLIAANTQTPITFTEPEKLQDVLSKALKNTSLTLGDVAELIVMKDEKALSAEEILTLMDAPPALSRNAKKLMVGVHAFDNNQPFLIIVVSPYEVAFDAMLSWEKKIAKSLGAFFAQKKASVAIPIPSFTDRVFQNIDIRDNENEWPLLYGFADQRTLVITTNKNTLKEILARLSTSQTPR